MKRAYCPPFTRCDCPSCKRALNVRFAAIASTVFTKEDVERIARECFRDFSYGTVTRFMNGN